MCFVPERKISNGVNSERAPDTISVRSGLGLKMGKFRQISTELWPLISVKI